MTEKEKKRETRKPLALLRFGDDMKSAGQGPKYVGQQSSLVNDVCDLARASTLLCARSGCLGVESSAAAHGEHERTKERETRLKAPRCLVSLCAERLATSTDWQRGATVAKHVALRLGEHGKESLALWLPTSDQCCVFGLARRWHLSKAETALVESIECDRATGLYHGSLTKWHHNGTLAKAARYDCGLLHGERRTFHIPPTPGDTDECGSYPLTLDAPRFTEHMDENGIVRKRWPCGWPPRRHLASFASFVRGRIEGNKVTWYRNGQMRTMQNYDGGERRGRFRMWYLCGAPKMIGARPRDKEQDDKWLSCWHSE